LTISSKCSNILKKGGDILNIIKRIQKNFDGLSNKQKFIASYLIDNQSNVPFMSLGELSAELGVSEVTILNFCKSIELNSFVDMKKCFQDLIKENLKVPAKMKSSLEEITSVEDALKNAIQTQRFNFDKLSMDNSLDRLNDASLLIANARNVYLCGMGVSKLVCEFLQGRLRSLGINSIKLNLEDISLYSQDLDIATEDDLFILISFPDYSLETIKLRDFLELNKLKFIAITNDIESPISENAKVTLISENKSLVFYNFISSTITLAEILLIVLSYNIKDSLLPNIKRIKKIQEFFSND